MAIRQEKVALHLNPFWWVAKCYAKTMKLNSGSYFQSVIHFYLKIIN